MNLPFHIVDFLDEVGSSRCCDALLVAEDTFVVEAFIAEDFCNVDVIVGFFVE